MRVVLDFKGLHKTTQKLASGERKAYYYAWAGGPRMEAEFGTPAFATEFEKHQTDAKKSDDEIFRGVIRLYREHKLPFLAQETQRDYQRLISEIELEFGDMPIPKCEQDYLATRQEFNFWRDNLNLTPRATDKRWGMLSTLCSFAIKRGKMTVNPCQGGEKLWRGTRKDEIWTDAQIAVFRQQASPQVLLVFDLALDTGQRQKDILNFTWSQFDGERINLGQSKRGKRVSILLDGELAEWIRKLPNSPENSDTPTMTICANSFGKPWTGNGFRASFNAIRKRAGISNVNFHDLRGTAVVLAAIDGADEYALASRFGWTLGQVTKMLDRHYLAPSQQRADEIVHLRKGKKRTSFQNASKTRKAREA